MPGTNIKIQNKTLVFNVQPRICQNGPQNTETHFYWIILSKSD